MLRELDIQAFDPRKATDEEYAAANRMNNQMRAEREPDDPPMTLEEDIQRWRSIPTFVDVKAWGIWNDERTDLIATGSVAVLRLEQNQHIAEVGIEVLPAYRRRGIARQLLSRCIEVAQQEKRRLILCDTNSTVPAGEAFVKRVGGELGLSMHTNQLKIAELDRRLVGDWLARGEQNSANFELEWVDGAFPEGELESIAEFLHVMNQQPRENLDVEDWQMTAEHLREFDQSMLARGQRRWTLFVRERATGKRVGYSEVFWHPSRAEILEQGGTGVAEAYRNLGLGRWLKAAMLNKVLRERPDVTRVRTGNAYSNAPMLKINAELGFQPYRSLYHWQVPTDKVLAYLASGS